MASKINGYLADTKTIFFMYYLLILKFTKYFRLKFKPYFKFISE